MELEKIAAVVRPRRPWEAVDLGFSLARTWWAAVVRPWLAAVLPVFVVVAVALHSYPRSALLVLWWLKPLYDRVPLFVLSRALFGATPGVRETLRALPGLWTSHAFGALTLWRFDPMRSFLLSIGQLEGLRGGEHQERSALLRRFDTRTAGWLTWTCLGFELLTLGGLFGLVEMLRPEEVAWSLGEGLTALAEGRPTWVYALVVAFAFLAMSLVEPFYVAGGFALYLNRRTHLEGWDVEIAFRRLARRLGASVRAAAVLLAAALAFPGTPAAAQTGGAADEPQEAVEEVLNDDVFGGRRTVTRWRLRFVPEATDRSQEDLDLPPASAAGALVGVLRIVVLALLALGILALVVFIARRLGRAPRAGPAGRPEPPPVVCGLDIRPESLPADVVRAARDSWRAERFDEALGLLYRGALAALAVRQRLPMRESWTEGDCLASLKLRGAPPLVEYFARLTTAWQAAAYAHRPPADAEMEALCTAWPGHFGGSR